MRIRNRSTLALLLITIFVLPLAVACEQAEQGPAEELGESIDDAIDEIEAEGKDLGDQLEEAGEEMKEGVEDVKEEIEGDG